MRKEYSLIFILFIFLCVLGISDICSARAPLEVGYPPLPTGETVTQTTPLPEYIKYVFNFGVLMGFLATFISLIMGGFLYITSAGRPEKLKEAKAQIFAAISGMVFLITIYLIIITINPGLRVLGLPDLGDVPGIYLKVGGEWIYQNWNVPDFQDSQIFNTPPTAIKYICPTVPGVGAIGRDLIIRFYGNAKYRGSLIDTEEIACGHQTGTHGRSCEFSYKQPGIYLYKNTNCQGKSSSVVLSSNRDLEEFENQVGSLKIVNNNSDNIYYGAILHKWRDYQDDCLIILPVLPNNCLSNVSLPVSSITIYRYLPNPDGNNVTFYRKPFYNNEGGTFAVGKSDIVNIYSKWLKYLRFNDVPKEEKECIAWDIFGGNPEENYCTLWEAPNLAGKNTSSIKIDDDFLVILIASQELEWGCQVFPTLEDVNQEGPKQLKWEYVNRDTRSPDYLYILSGRRL